MNKSFNNSTPKIVGGILISAMLVIGIYALLLNDPESNSSTNSTSASSSSSTSSANQSASSPSTSTATTNTATSTTYKDGDYSATQSYRVPDNINKITVKVSIKNGVVTSVTTSHDYASSTSSDYTSSFSSEISGQVVGKSIDSISLSRVGGASLTTQGFDKAINAIASQAKA
ncbi:MAG TPA: hypothetical protein VMR45_04500 [Patescibacteria group bacterium]|nr:hypothetical protein [Patescibacteria group bacterium]